MDNEKLEQTDLFEDKKIEDDTKNQRPTAWANAWDWIKSLVIAVVLALLIREFVIEPTLVQGSSMEQTLSTGDRVLVNKIVLKVRPIERGDIVVMHFNPSDEDYIKRVIGLPGEQIQLIDGHFYINGEHLDEAYINGDYTHHLNQFEWALAEGEYFLVGDNRLPHMSRDSRDFGPVHIEDIKGVANFRFYPFGEDFGGLK